jgi:hypothetical protein
MISHMAYDVSYFFDRRNQAPEALLDEAVAWIRRHGVKAEMAGVSYGRDWPQALDWVAGDLLVDSEPTGISIEIHGDEPITAKEWQWASALRGAPARTDVTGVCIVTLVGDTNYDAFKAVQSFWCTERSASELDETDGFTDADANGSL